MGKIAGDLIYGMSVKIWYKAGQQGERRRGERFLVSLYVRVSNGEDLGRAGLRGGLSIY
jgi:hypothetical protein